MKAAPAESAVPRINRTLKHMSPPLLPPQAPLTQFDVTWAALASRGLTWVQESCTIRASRTSPLANLISGKLRIRAACRFIRMVTVR